MAKTEVIDLLNAGVHFGHLTRKWNPNMAPYIYMERNGIHIINLYKTAVKIQETNAALKKIATTGRKILFVATKKQAKDIVEEKAKSYGVKVIKYKSDASSFEQSSELIDNVIKDFGSYDILINNAGITRDNLLLRMDEESWKKVIDINLNSCFNLTKCAIREFMKKKKV